VEFLTNQFNGFHTGASSETDCYCASVHQINDSPHPVSRCTWPDLALG